MPGYSLHIGLNAVDPDHYAGWGGKLGACENDMEDMAAISRRAGLEFRTLSTRSATRRSVQDALTDLASMATPDDLILVTYSGHGGQVPDLGKDEPYDRFDETWCLFDGQLLDDELLVAWSKFPAGSRIVVISDSCHSGGMERFRVEFNNSRATEPSVARVAPPSIVRRTFEQNEAFYVEIQRIADSILPAKVEEERQQAIKASVRLLSACSEQELSYETGENGDFTNAIVNAWDFGRFAGNYSAFFRRACELTPVRQSPQHKVFGTASFVFDGQPPFHV